MVASGTRTDNVPFRAGAGANAIINESCQFGLAAGVDSITISMRHKNKLIGSRTVSIADTRHCKVAATAQIEDQKGYGVGTVEYEVEVIGAQFSVCPLQTLQS